MWAELDHARSTYHEDAAGAKAVAERAEAEGRARGDGALRGRALALRAMIAIDHGALREAFAIAAEAEAEAERSGDDALTVEVAAMGAHLSFFSGSYREALRQAERGVRAADATGDRGLHIYARRCACLVFGNLDVPEWPDMLQELLALTIDADADWEEAISRNDLAHLLLVRGDPDGATVEIGRALAVADRLAPHNHFALGVLLCTRAEIHLGAGRGAEALVDARAAQDHLAHGGAPNPYLFGTSVHAEVRALLTGGQVDAAWECGKAGVARLDHVVPQIRSTILQDLAGALRAAGRSDEAYDALAEGAELERLAYRELTELQRELERVVHQHGAARLEVDSLSTKNLQLETMVNQLAEAHRELEALQGLLRDQAERDWLTGLFNRRYLAGVLERADAAVGPEPLSVAALDLDHFKAINDRFGHDVGDRVLARTASVLQAQVRGTDVVARTGGEEFVIVMAGTAEADAIACAERVRAALVAEPWGEIAPGLAITASIGVVCAQDTAVDAVVRLADRRLYAAKRAGRNRVDAHSFAA
jgi:diguanylate cyclase (GGDEF)-like protein